MNDRNIRLIAIDEAEVLTLIDNVSDVFLASSERVKRPKFHENSLTVEPLVAEHGYSIIVRVKVNGTLKSLILDTGLSKDGLVKNLDTMGVQAGELDAIVLSHGHADHTKGLSSLLDRVGDIPLYVHPDVFLSRKLCLPNGTDVTLPPPDRQMLIEKGANIIENTGPTWLFEDRLLLTGQIPRLTEFENGMPSHFSNVNGDWKEDREISDDQAIVLFIRNKGLVILTGCCHSGMVNTVKYARELTGIKEIFAVIGGFHLSGPAFEPIIQQTVTSLKSMNPAVIVPAHCTGWKATHEIAKQFPEAFVQNSVGTSYILNSG